MKPNPSQLRLLSDNDLDRELTSGEHDEYTRNGIVFEKIRRVSHARSRVHWIHWPTYPRRGVGGRDLCGNRRMTGDRRLG